MSLRRYPLVLSCTPSPYRCALTAFAHTDASVPLRPSKRHSTQCCEGRTCRDAREIRVQLPPSWAGTPVAEKVYLVHCAPEIGVRTFHSSHAGLSAITSQPTPLAVDESIQQQHVTTTIKNIIDHRLPTGGLQVSSQRQLKWGICWVCRGQVPAGGIASLTRIATIQRGSRHRFILGS